MERCVMMMLGRSSKVWFSFRSNYYSVWFNFKVFPYHSTSILFYIIISLPCQLTLTRTQMTRLLLKDFLTST